MLLPRWVEEDGVGGGAGGALCSSPVSARLPVASCLRLFHGMSSEYLSKVLALSCHGKDLKALVGGGGGGESDAQRGPAAAAAMKSGGCAFVLRKPCGGANAILDDLRRLPPTAGANTHALISST